MSGHVEIVKNNDFVGSYVITWNPSDKASLGATADTARTQSRPSIVLMGKDDSIYEFMDYELKKFNNTNARDKAETHPFIIPSVINPNGYDLYARNDKEYITLLIAIGEWGRIAADISKEEIMKQADCEVPGVPGPVYEYDVDGACVGSEDEGSEGLWQGPMVMTYSDKGVELVEEIMKKRDADAARELYEQWIGKFEMHIGH